MTAAGATGLGYDGRGNLISSGSSGYGYTMENQLVSGPGTTMIYEPGGGQLLQSYNTATGVGTRFAWSGSQMIAEINASSWSIPRRYVPGPGTDETVPRYEVHIPDLRVGRSNRFGCAIKSQATPMA